MMSPTVRWLCIVLMVFTWWMMVSGSSGFDLSDEQQFYDGDPVMNVMVGADEIPRNAFLYVYDEKKDVWNRARSETLVKAKCEHIRGLLTVADRRE